MDARFSGWKCRVALTVCLAFGLAGCSSVITIHSIAAAGDEPSPVPDLSGFWVLEDESSLVHALRVVEAAELNVGQCRDVTVHSLNGAPEDPPFRAELVTEEICFVPVAGHLIAQLSIDGLYAQFLFRFDEESISFCRAVWSDLEQWVWDHPEATTAFGLQFTRRGEGSSHDLFIISRRSELLSYLETRMPAAVKACEERDDFLEGWTTYVRLTPPRRPDAAGAAERTPGPRN